MIIPLRLYLASSLKSRAAHLVHSGPARGRQVAESFVVLLVALQSLGKRAFADGVKILQLARTSGERLLTPLRLPLTSLCKLAAIAGVETVRCGISRVIGLATRVNPFLASPFKRGTVEEVPGRRDPCGPVVGRSVGATWIAGFHAGLGRLPSKPYLGCARIARNIVKVSRVSVSRVTRWLVLMTSEWALYRETFSQRMSASLSVTRNIAGAMRTSLPGPFETTVGTLRLIRISSAMLAVLIATALVMWMPELARERKGPSEDDRLYSGAQDPAALKQRESTATVERAEISAPIPRRVPPSSKAGLGVGPPPETRRSARPLAPVQAEIPAPGRTPAPVLGEESPAQSPARSDGATTVREPLSAPKRHRTVDAPDVSDPSAVIDWLLKEHRQEK
jgi:hypothetical protein